MKSFRVLGPGCANCQTTVRLIQSIASQKGVEVTVEKVEDYREIVSYGVLSTPGVVVDGEVVHAGGVPSRGKVEGWFAEGA